MVYPSHIRIVDNNVITRHNGVTNLHVGVWYPWFIDTASGWIVQTGQKWNDLNYTRWSEDDLRTIIRDIRDTFKCNIIRCFFWMDWVTGNLTSTLSSYYPVADIGSQDALKALCSIADQEGVDVELRMWGWNGTNSRDPLLGHTEAQFKAAWVTVANIFKVYPNVCFNLYDEPTIAEADWITLAKNTITDIRAAGVTNHVIYVHYLYAGAEGIAWIRTFGNQSNVAFSRHEYIVHGTTEAMHQATLTIHAEGYPITVTASGVYQQNTTEIETYRRWYRELLSNNIGFTFYTYGRPNVMGFRLQENTAFPCAPNNVGDMFISAALGNAPDTTPTEDEVYAALDALAAERNGSRYTYYVTNSSSWEFPTAAWRGSFKLAAHALYGEYIGSVQWYENSVYIQLFQYLYRAWAGYTPPEPPDPPLPPPPEEEPPEEPTPPPPPPPEEEPPSTPPPSGQPLPPPVVISPTTPPYINLPVNPSIAVEPRNDMLFSRLLRVLSSSAPPTFEDIRRLLGGAKPKTIHEVFEVLRKYGVSG